MELAITKYLREHGLEKTLADFKLKHKDYPHKVLIKYDSIESNFSNEEVRDARGLVVEKGTWKVMSLAFRKFFNYGEGHAAPVDWKTSRIFKKLDGSMIHVYHDYITGEICFGTTGTAEGEGDVDNFHCMRSGGTFSDLFVTALIDTIERNSSIKFGEMEFDSKKKYAQAWLAKPSYTLAFELCTPYNVVVTPHQINSVYLIGARRLDTLEEVSFEELERISKEIKVPVAPTILLNSTAENLKESFDGMPYSEEGYVICDYVNHGPYGFPRQKMKNPAYCAIHFFKDSTAFWRIVDIVRGGDDNVNEYKATFPGRGNEMDYIQKGWHELIDKFTQFASVIETFDEYIEYSKHKDSITFESKGLSPGILNRLNLHGITIPKQVLSLSDEELTEMLTDAAILYDKTFIKKEIEAIRKTCGDRGDDIATDLRKKAASKIMKWVTENNLKDHQGFFFNHLEGSKSIKKYLRELDGKQLYNQLIIDYKPEN